MSPIIGGIVGIGASAGGIQALSALFDAMPADSGLAFIVVLHLDPTRESQLSSILAYHTQMPVVEIENGMRAESDHVYVIAPDRDLTLEGDTLCLTEPAQSRGHRHPVDVLFRSLAEQRAERAAAIVLSGTGTNGTHGLKEIKAAGGLILIQSPETAQFDGMPRSAIGAGLADEVLAPGDMAGILLRYFRRSYVAAPDGLAAEPAKQQPMIEQLLDLLRTRSGQEFRSFKPSTLLRRVHRRMSLKSLNELEPYIALLQTEPDEVKALVRDLLISVTGFFRDAAAWRTLDETVLSQLVADRDSGAAIRVWVPACATGEEAYSVAMMLTERAEAARKQFDLKVFASDVLDENLNAARAGMYPGASVEMLSPGRIRRFFEKLDGSYQISKSLRDQMVFARQDLLRDPPFSRMDLITCRNMLIYIEPEAQRRALALVHFALREGGRLFLGSSESIGRAEDLFDTISKQWRIYRRIGPTRHDIVDFPLLGGHPRAAYQADAPASHAPVGRVTDMARRALLDRYAPASVVIDQKGNILYFHGDTSDYLKQPDGEPTRDLLAMARPGLSAKLRGAVHTALGGSQDASFSTLINQGDTVRQVRVTFSRLPASQQTSDLVLVTFEPERQAPVPATDKPERTDERDASTALENELREVRAELHGTIGQLEGANEELKAANEEATSMNEELQSTNEELETSREEMQSFNEELHTVNNQLQHKVQELEDTGNDLANLLAGTETATVFLDTALWIKWFSPAMERLMAFVSSDIGRPISHFATKFTDGFLLQDCKEVLDRLVQIDAEIQSDERRWFLRRVLPYRTRDTRIDGLVITFTDITESKRASDTINEARIYAEAIVTTARQPLVILDADLRVRSANLAFYALSGAASDRTEGRRLYEQGNGEWDNPELRRLLEEVLPKDQHFQDVEIAFGPAEPRRRHLLVNARRLLRNSGREDLILLAIEDVTERYRAAQHQEMLIGELNHRVKNVLATIQAITSETLRRSETLEDFRGAFVGRMHALAQAHDLIVEKVGVGAEIGQLVAQTLAPYRTDDARRIVIKGPILTVQPRIGVSLVLVLHEMATNAAKYGALSVPGGTLSVEWSRDSDAAAGQVHVLWHEAGGPMVVPPARRGFGTKLIERSMEYELEGKARLEYLKAGLHCELIFPCAWLQSGPAGV